MDREAQSLDVSSENPNVSLSAEKPEEPDYVNVPEGAEKNVSAAPGHMFPSFSHFFPQLAAYWLILLVVIPLHIHFHLIAQFELKHLKANQTLLLEEIYNLTTKLDEVKNKTQQLLKQIETMEKTWNEQNVSRAQWSVDEYCLKENKDRKCSPCQKNWLQSQSSCYAVYNAEPQDQKTWKEARENCSGKISDLTVVGDEGEKKFVKDKSWVNDKIKGYWIGLRAEGGKWRWIDGSDLTNQAWIQQQPADDGQCVTSLQNRGWRSESCDEKNAWICEKKALSV